MRPCALEVDGRKIWDTYTKNRKMFHNTLHTAEYVRLRYSRGRALRNLAKLPEIVQSLLIQGNVAKSKNGCSRAPAALRDVVHSPLATASSFRVALSTSSSWLSMVTVAYGLTETIRMMGCCVSGLSVWDLEFSYFGATG